MAKYNKGLELYQWGKETVRGTAVAATSKLAVEQLKFKHTDAVSRPKIAKGLMVANRGNEVVVARGTEWEIPDTPVVANQLHAFMAMALQGAQAPTGAGPYVWTHTRVPTADPVLDSRTLEIRLTDGTTPTDSEYAYAMLQHLEVAFAENESLKFNAKGFARRWQTSVLTAAQALPSIAVPPSALSQIYIDDTFAALGTTPIAGQVLGWRWKFDTGIKPEVTADARTDLDFATDSLDPDEVKMGLEIVIFAQPSGQWATEKTKAEGALLRAIEARVTNGADIIKLQGLYKHTPGSIFPDDFKDGSRIVTLQLEGSTDDTNFAKSIITNSQATMV